MSVMLRSSWTVKRKLDGQVQTSTEVFIVEQSELPNMTFRTELHDSLGVVWEVELVATFDPPLEPVVTDA